MHYLFRIDMYSHLIDKLFQLLLYDSQQNSTFDQLYCETNNKDLLTFIK